MFNLFRRVARLETCINDIRDILRAQWEVVRTAEGVGDRLHGQRIAISRLEREVSEMRDELTMYRELAVFGNLPGQRTPQQAGVPNTPSPKKAE